MPPLKKTSLIALDAVKDIRVTNNDLWMEILRIALEANPVRTRHIIQQIRENDKEVTHLMDCL